MMEIVQLMGAPIFKTDGWAQSGPTVGTIWIKPEQGTGVSHIQSFVPIYTHIFLLGSYHFYCLCPPWGPEKIIVCQCWSPLRPPQKILPLPHKQAYFNLHFQMTPGVSIENVLAEKLDLSCMSISGQVMGYQSNNWKETTFRNFFTLGECS